MAKRRRNQDNTSILFISESELYMAFILKFPLRNNDVLTKEEKIITMATKVLLDLRSCLKANVQIGRDNSRADTFTVQGKHFNYVIDKYLDMNTISKVLKNNCIKF